MQRSNSVTECPPPKEKEKNQGVAMIQGPNFRLIDGLIAVDKRMPVNLNEIK